MTGQRPRIVQRAVSGSASIPAPTGGWNARDSIADMEITDAVYLTNFVPFPSDVRLRDGFSEWATGLPDQVESLLFYSGGSSNQFFAASGGDIYDVTASGAVGTADVTGLSNDRHQYVNIATASGNYIRTVNGVDKSYIYDGTNWTQDGSGAPADITGVDSADLLDITLFKNRIWFIEKGSLNAWYLGTGNVGGAATKFPLQGVAKLGGQLMALESWTIDAGEGMDDYLVFVTSNGEIIIYKGTDPSAAATFTLQGVWKLGNPMGTRCMRKFAGDILLICADGLVPLSGAIQSSRVNPRVALTDKIQQAVSDATSSLSTNFGWDILYHPKFNLLFLNVPVATGQQQQYVMHTITKAWCNFTGWAANCWELFGDDAYFGADGIVCKAWTTLADDGNNIAGSAKQAFSYLKSPGKLKRFTMMRPIVQSNGMPNFLAGVNVDFEDTFIGGPPNFVPVVYGVWDTAVWDDGVWGGDLSVIKNWQGVNGVGYCVAPRLELASNGIECRWVASDLVFEQGAIL